MNTSYKLRISLIQPHTEWENIEANIRSYTKLIGNLNGESDIILLPEMFTTGFSMNVKELAEPINGPSTHWMVKQAQENGCAIAGSIIIKEEDKFYNRFLFAKPDGTIEQYNKRHLFRMGEENLHFTSGSKRVIIQYMGWRILPLICYDLRFPVWSRNQNDYDLILMVANFPSSRSDAWNTLNKARAIENQCYVAATNMQGTDGNGIHYSGLSQIVDPEGKHINCHEITPGVVYTGAISLKELRAHRKNFPAQSDADHFTIGNP